MRLIATQTLGSAQATITFSSIPQTFTDLRILLSPRSSQSGTTTETINVTFNSDGVGSGLYSSRWLRSNGSTASSSFTSVLTAQLSAPSGNTTANTFGNVQIYIPAYASGLTKIGSIEHTASNNAEASGLAVTSFLYNSSAAINSVTFALSNGNFIAGTQVAIYGITKGSDGIVTT